MKSSKKKILKITGAKKIENSSSQFSVRPLENESSSLLNKDPSSLSMNLQKTLFAKNDTRKLQQFLEPSQSDLDDVKEEFEDQYSLRKEEESLFKIQNLSSVKNHD